MIAQGRPAALPAFRRDGEAMSPPAGPFGRGRTAWALAACAALLAGFGEKAWLATPAKSAPASWVTSSEVTSSLPALHGAPMMARFERLLQRNGSEILRGETRLQFAGVARSLTVREEALVDREGRLVRAEIGVSSMSGETWAQVVSFDALTGVIVTRRGGRAETRRVATDQPWAYVPVAAPDGTWVSTPVAATVAERAAHAGGAIRLIDPSGADAAVMSDQIAGASGAEGWVVLGDDLAVFSENAAGASELVRMHVASLGVLVSADGAK